LVISYEKQATLGRPKILYTKAPQINLRLQETYINLGMIAELEGNVAEAQQNYLTAAGFRDGSAYAHFCLTLLYERMDLFDEAIAAYHTALHCDPNYLKALFNVARLYHIVVSALMPRRSIFPPKVHVPPALVVFGAVCTVVSLHASGEGSGLLSGSSLQG
jgi:tetratricopeptide (TPR) repeat protein